MDNKPLSVLMVDDNPNDVELTRLWLKKNYPGSSMLSAQTEEEIRERFASDKFDIIFLDYGFPKMSFEEALVTIRGLTKNTPIIVFSARSDDDFGKAVYEAGLEYVRKGFDSDNYVELKTKMERNLKQAENDRKLSALRDL